MLKIEDPSDTQDELATGQIDIEDLTAGVALVDIAQVHQQCAHAFAYMRCEFYFVRVLSSKHTRLARQR
jgi:hypothetical protein